MFKNKNIMKIVLFTASLLLMSLFFMSCSLFDPVSNLNPMI